MSTDLSSLNVKSIRVVITASIILFVIISYGLYDELTHATHFAKAFAMIPVGPRGCEDGFYPRLKEMSDFNSAIVIDTCGDFLKRIQQFNIGLDIIRSDLLNKNRPQEWNISFHDQMRELFEWKEDFLQSLSNYSQIKAVVFPWIKSKTRSEWSSLTDTSNILIQNYYESTATDTLCTWIETPGQVGSFYDIVNNWTCSRDIKQAIRPRSLSLLSLNAIIPIKNYYFPSIYPEHFFQQTPRFIYMSYIIIQGIVTPKGFVFTNKAKVVPYSCYADRSLHPPTNVNKIPVHREILVLSQPYGELLYHRMIEVIPRIAMYLEFLRRNPTVKIQALEDGGRTAELLGILGFAKHRIVTGWCRAEIVYLPRASMCCFANIPEIQILSRSYRSYIEKNLKPEIRNKILLIKRTKRRYFPNYPAIEEVLQEAANTYNLSFEIFRDNPAPSLNDTMRLFYSAVMVIGPHGAGLANLVFSQPGTYVIEGVCNRPYALLFFQRLALALGHRWHGMPATGGCYKNGAVTGSLNIATATINSTVLSHLKQVAQESA